MRGSFRAHPTAPSPADAHAGISPVFLKLLADEPLEGRTVLDVGTGRGRLALTLAPRCGRVVGIDRDETALADARRAAAVAGLTNVEFVARAGRALARGAPFAFVAFHADQWKETGRRSRFAWSEDEARAALEGAGFAIEHLSVERDVQAFGSVEEALAASIGLEEKWRADGRWFRYIKFLEDGGRTLTRAHLHVKARKK